VFRKPYTSGSTLLPMADPGGIDAEVFIDDDGRAYLFWGRRHVARLAKDMITVDTTSIQVIQAPHKAYSEGPIFFKRKGIYYYLYTLGGSEGYQYAYVMSKTSPMGPYEAPAQDIISTTNRETGVFGPGHGSVFHAEGTDHYYFVYLEYGRRSTNRQTYVNRMEFNPDGTIRPVQLDLDGVGPFTKQEENQTTVAAVYASSTAVPRHIRPTNDTLCRRTEYFVPTFAVDRSNGSRWMAAEGDDENWIIADLGTTQKVARSEVYFVRPTAGHAYQLEGSADGKVWQACGGHDDVRVMSPHVDTINKAFRYLRIRITEGIKGIWEWNIYE
jgi:hypothetical protein